MRAADYLRIAHEYHTIILDHVPVMTFDNRNAAKRFIILIDTLYDMNVKLIASAAAEPDALYRADEGYEAQEFQRTASRLIEMRSQEYLARPHGAAHSHLSGSSSGMSRPDRDRGDSRAGRENLGGFATKAWRRPRRAVRSGRLERACRTG